MPQSSLTYPLQECQESSSLHDDLQIALAIAEENVLKSLLVHCTPSLAQPHRLGSVTSTVGIPIKSKKAVDGIIQFESINCMLVDAPVETDPQWAESSYGNSHSRRPSLTRCESETHILGQCMPLAQTISLLAHSGFAPHQVETILHLPYEAWHKTWWYTLDGDGNFTVPFLRLIRTLRYTDGTFTVQYKDYFSQDKPTCFRSREEKVLVEIKTEPQSFKKTLEKINYSREQCGVAKAILITNTISELEARGFISQDISIYATRELMLPVQANCARCVTRDCPLQGRPDSPVMMCRQFCLDGQIN